MLCHGRFFSERHTSQTVRPKDLRDGARPSSHGGPRSILATPMEGHALSWPQGIHVDGHALSWPHLLRTPHLTDRKA